MGCKNCSKNYVWKFTNKKQLCKNCFCDYFERKIFATIRKFGIMPKNREFKIKNDKSLNANVVAYVLKKKFNVNFAEKTGINTTSLSQIAERIFFKILVGNFNNKIKNESPLYYLSDKEIELYARIKGISGKRSDKDDKISKLFNRFKQKNPDLEHNIINAFDQLR